MERDELLKEWSNKFFEETTLEDNGANRVAVLYVLRGVFQVGYDTGYDAHKMEHQLSQLGKPHGIGSGWDSEITYEAHPETDPEDK